MTEERDRMLFGQAFLRNAKAVVSSKFGKIVHKKWIDGYIPEDGSLTTVAKDWVKTIFTLVTSQEGKIHGCFDSSIECSFWNE